MFRVYRGLLAKHSIVFRDMFSLPYSKESTDQELFDGVPVVHMTDHWEDVQHFLKVFLDRKSVAIYLFLIPSLFVE